MAPFGHREAWEMCVAIQEALIVSAIDTYLIIGIREKTKQRVEVERLSANPPIYQNNPTCKITPPTNMVFYFIGKSSLSHLIILVYLYKE